MLIGSAQYEGIQLGMYCEFEFSVFTDLIAVYFNGPIVHFAHRLDFQVVSMHVPLAFSGDVLVKILGHVGGKVVFVFNL